MKVVLLKANAADLRTLDKLAGAGQLRVVTQHFLLEQIRAAWELSISGRTAGKIIIEVANKYVFLLQTCLFAVVSPKLTALESQNRHDHSGF